MSLEHPDLYSALHRVINTISEEQGADITSERLVQLTQSLYSFTIAALTKYSIGAVEHDDSDITDIDLDREIMNEVIDLLMYLSAKKWKKQKQ